MECLATAQRVAKAIADEQSVVDRGPKYNGNGMRNVDQSIWSFDANGFIWSEGEKYDAKDCRIVFDLDKDIMSRVNLESGTVGVLDSNVECLNGISYQGKRRCSCKVDDERAHEQYANNAART